MAFRTRRDKKASSYLIVAAGIVVVLGLIFTVSYKYNMRFSCDLVNKYYGEFALHILNSLYAINRFPEGEFRMNVGDEFRYLLTKESLTIYYEGKCKTNNNVISLPHNIKNVITSTSHGYGFCVKKSINGISLC